ncbi:hypothetical protein [Reichenbachiella sp. MSK19-1]|uniref:hypothetical protein n=1 Tax=Reichenbachiella sp. MSK19-1 TaxID=1897631 RepID=UPI000E6BBA63|nr:hypothetical protein [Reichenbachiella sp. MSK19-1]RJE72509.1 hypothetical protein BGP76_00595 [Reichenbachiella sp. MSK19-1]
MKIENRIVAFVDILGFANLIKEYDQNGDSTIVEDLKEAVNSAVWLITPRETDKKNPILFHWKECVEIKLFSDCLCMSAPLEYKGYTFLEQFEFFYKYLITYQLILMEKGYFSRGGITTGSYYSDENMIFSGGLVDAYGIESKIAKHPRIVVDQKIVEMLSKSEDKYNVLQKMLVFDPEEICFLNHFNYKTVDSAQADYIMTSGMIPEIEGMLNETFTEESERDKKQTLEKILKIVRGKIDKHEGESFCNKFKWLERFILNEQGEITPEFKNYTPQN